jgi:hypothetical protein
LIVDLNPVVFFDLCWTLILRTLSNPPRVHGSGEGRWRVAGHPQGLTFIHGEIGDACICEVVQEGQLNTDSTGSRCSPLVTDEALVVTSIGAVCGINVDVALVLNLDVTLVKI